MTVPDFNSDFEKGKIVKVPADPLPELFWKQLVEISPGAYIDDEGNVHIPDDVLERLQKEQP